MRNLSTAAQAAASKQYGSEPVNIIEVQWVQGGPRTPYADKDVATIPGRILELSNLDFIVNISNGSDSAEISVILSDIDGSLKNIIDTTDVHKRDVWVYQWFDGIDPSEKFLLFHGVINSPLVWNEGDRTLRFTVITKIEDAEIGFSIEEGQFVNLPSNLIGKPWPLKFGTTFNVPALRFAETVRGTLLTGVGIADYWLPFKITSTLVCPSVFTGFFVSIIGNQQVATPNYEPDPGCLVQACQLIREAEIQYAEQLNFQFQKFRVLGGDKFAQGVPFTLDINGGKFTGFFGDPDPLTFTVTSRVHPAFEEFGPATKATIDAILEDNRATVSTGCGFLQDPNDTNRQLFGDQVINLYASELSFARFNAIPTPGFFWAASGTDVRIAADQEIVYASNIVPEIIHRVAAFRQLDSQRRLVTVPPEYYSHRSSDFNGYDVSEIVFPKALSQIDETWEDEIYITSTSSVGPNTVNIMEWLIDKYTDLLTDPVSFNNARGRLENYPMDFPYLERKNILQALRELAYQARCAIYLRDDRFYLKYLGEVPESNDIIAADDIDANTLELLHSNTEDIVTKYVAEWKRDYSLDDPNVLILRHNVSKYGVQEETFDYYAYNELDYISKSATFWIIRTANTWRKVSFQTPPHKLALETFDSIDFNVPSIFPTAVPGVVEQADYDSATRTITFQIHTNVKSGSLVPYPFYYSGDIDQELIWPTSQEWVDGIVGSGPNAPGFSVIAPPGHPLELPQFSTGFSLGTCAAEGLPTLSQHYEFEFASQGGSQRRQNARTCGDDKGDSTPSDADDSKVPKNLESDASIPQTEPYTTPNDKLKELGGKPLDQQAKKIADKAFETSLTNTQRSSNANEAAGGAGSGTGGGSGPGGAPTVPDLPTKDQLEDAKANEQDGQACLFTANIFLNKPTVYGGPNGGNAAEGASGFVGTSVPERVDRFTFATCKEAQRFVCGVLTDYSKKQQAQTHSGTDSRPVNANVICPNYFPPCQNEDVEPSETNPNGLPVPIGFESVKPDGIEPFNGADPSGYSQNANKQLSDGECPP